MLEALVDIRSIAHAHAGLASMAPTMRSYFNIALCFVLHVCAAVGRAGEWSNMLLADATDAIREKRDFLVVLLHNVATLLDDLCIVQPA